MNCARLIKKQFIKLDVNLYSSYHQTPLTFSQVTFLHGFFGSHPAVAVSAQTGSPSYFLRLAPGRGSILKAAVHDNRGFVRAWFRCRCRGVTWMLKSSVMESSTDCTCRPCLCLWTRQTVFDIVADIEISRRRRNFLEYRWITTTSPPSTST